MSKYESILGNTMVTIASDLEQACNECGESLTAAGLAESAIEMVFMYGNDDALVTEFSDLPYEEQSKIAITVANYYI